MNAITNASTHTTPHHTTPQQGNDTESKSALNELAFRLADKARTLSLDKTRDSPFAILAKENDIMWGGGMPDDTSVVVARVVRDNS
jgi:protein phosphatase PTC7